MEGVRVYGREIWLPEGVATESRASKDPIEKRDFFVHYSAFGGMDVDTFDEQIATMRAIYRDHTTNPAKLWDDIGYSWIVMQPWGGARRAAVFEGRGWDRIPAAQYGYNSGSIAVCVVTLYEEILPATVVALNKLFHESKCERVRGHREVGNTGCPGDKLMSLLDEIAADEPDPPQPKPPQAPPYEGALFSGVQGARVRKWQRQMKRRGWNIKVDGIYGTRSERFCKRFQRKQDLLVDGIVGRETWKETWTAPRPQR